MDVDGNNMLIENEPSDAPASSKAFRILGINWFFRLYVAPNPILRILDLQAQGPCCRFSGSLLGIQSSLFATNWGALPDNLSHAGFTSLKSSIYGTQRRPVGPPTATARDDLGIIRSCRLSRECIGGSGCSFCSYFSLPVSTTAALPSFLPLHFPSYFWYISSLLSRIMNRLDGMPMRGCKRMAEDFIGHPLKSRKTHRYGIAHTSMQKNSVQRLNQHHGKSRTLASGLRPLLTANAISIGFDATTFSNATPLPTAAMATVSPFFTHLPSPPNEKAPKSLLISSFLGACGNTANDPASHVTTSLILHVDVAEGAPGNWASDTRDLLLAIDGASVDLSADKGTGLSSVDAAATASAEWANEVLDVLNTISGAVVVPSASGPHPTPGHSVKRPVAEHQVLDTSLEMFLMGRSAWWSSPAIWFVSD
ncbi:hypothetical protein BV25DRAFT_1843261 [Artomyces pyxidatus]|uniref:Uncharacterized protein n=1 Tax=Artomyces pyxidatus TaxID=48021 RepID=A0ACB8SGK0_9AGAM|nr:hypothetical protein BV25DRAFT_1843261 [Artomyces pyxidatus]